jgi:methionyl aminopeptidase
MELIAPADVPRLRHAARTAAETLAVVREALTPGMCTADIDRLVRRDTARRGGRPSQLGYEGFPAAVCTSVNEVVCHGIPRDDVVLRPGDLVNVDVTTEVDGFHGDLSATFLIGEVAAERVHLVEATERALWAAIREVRPGARIGDLGAAIVAVAEAAGLSVVRDYTGHGIGRQMHLPPQIPHFGVRGRGLRLHAGMAFTIEPMLNLGGADTRTLDDGWTVVTADGQPSAQFEHTVLVTPEGCEVLTRL